MLSKIRHYDIEDTSFDQREEELFVIFDPKTARFHHGGQIKFVPVTFSSCLKYSNYNKAVTTVKHLQLNSPTRQQYPIIRYTANPAEMTTVDYDESDLVIRSEDLYFNED